LDESGLGDFQIITKISDYGKFKHSKLPKLLFFVDTNELPTAEHLLEKQLASRIQDNGMHILAKQPAQIYRVLVLQFEGTMHVAMMKYNADIHIAKTSFTSFGMGSEKVGSDNLFSVFEVAAYCFL
jgi:hypothetical protein